MTHDDTKQATAHTPEPWNCDGRTTLYATPDESDAMTMIEVRANVTDAGWDTVAFVEAIWPGAAANARRIAAAVNACKGLSTEALEHGIIAMVRHVLGELVTTAGDLDAVLDGATDQFDAERSRLNAVLRAAQAVLDDGMELDLHEVLAARRQIAAIWLVEDVQEVRPDLTDEQAWQVLQQVEHYHDCNDGITWDTLEIIADMLFGPAPETAEMEE